MTAEEIAKEEAELAASIKEQQELLAAYKKVRAHQEALAAARKKEDDATPSEGESTRTKAHRVRTRRSAPETFTESDGDGVNKSDAVREAIAEFDGPFTVNDIHHLLAIEGTYLEKSDVSFVLSRFARTGEIFHIEQGSGRRPSTYSATKPESEGSSKE